MKYNFTKQFVIIFKEKTNIRYNKYTENYFETDDINEYNDMLNFVKNNTEHILCIDMKNNHVLYNTLTNNSDKKNIYTDWAALEHYIGDGKTIEDFKDKAKIEEYRFHANNNPDMHLWNKHEFQAFCDYRDYLKKTWRKHNKEKKKLPSMQVYDDPYMVNKEIKELQKVEKEKKEIIAHRYGDL